MNGFIHGLGLTSAQQASADAKIAQYGEGKDCGKLATWVDTYRRLSNKTDKSSATRIAAGEVADQLGAAYTRCMAVTGASAGIPSAPTAASPAGISAPQTVSTPAQDKTIRYLIYGGLALALVVGGVWAYKRYGKGR